MLYEVNGRRRSSKTAREEVDDLKDQMASMTPAERVLFMKILEEMEGGKSATLAKLHKKHYTQPPVSVRKFLEDPYFLGVAGKQLYPQLKRDLIELCEGDYAEAVISGSIGFGKSTFAEFALLWQIYEFGLLVDPQEAFGLMPGSSIVLAIVSVNLKQARRGMLAGAIEKMARSPYFNAHFPYQVKESEGLIKFPKNISVVCGSPNSEQLIGLNVLGGVIDESNFMDSTHSSQTRASHAAAGYASNANALYRSIIRRMKSRFMRSGRMPGTLLMVSSKGTVGAFTEQRIKAAKNDPKVFVREYATWDVKPPKEFSGAKFFVLVGDELATSRILPPGEEESVKRQIAKPGRTARVIAVPVEYREDFEHDLDAALRDIAGMATMSIQPFIVNRQKINDAMDPMRDHPFTQETWDCSTNGKFLWGKLCAQTEMKVRGGFRERVWRPVVNPGAPRHVHIDTSLGKQDALGLAMGHIARWRDVERRSPDGAVFMELAPEVYIDFVLRVKPPPGGEIVLSDVRSLVYEMQAHGFQVAKVTTDRFQYADTHQKFRQKGVRAEILSMDTSPRAYEHLKSALYEDRLRCYRYEPLRRELIDLERDPVKGKIDHPVKGSDGGMGSKDCSDAVAGVVCSLVEDSPGRPLGVGVIGSFTDDADGYDDGWVLGPNKRARVVEPDGAPDMIPVPMLGSSWDGD